MPRLTSPGNWSNSPRSCCGPSGAAAAHPRGSRALTCFWEAVLGLRWFRDRATPEALARDHGISRATAYRYVDEVIAVLAEQAPDLHQALERAQDESLPHVILDGKIIPCDRCKEPAISVKGQVIDLWYSGKAHRHGGNIQAVLAPDGFPLWVSPRGARARCTTSPPPAPTLCPPSTGPPRLTCPPSPTPATTAPASAFYIPVKTARRRPGTRYQYPHPQCHPALAALPGRTRVRPAHRPLAHPAATSPPAPARIGDIARAALVLTHFEHGYIT